MLPQSVGRTSHTLATACKHNLLGVPLRWELDLRSDELLVLQKILKMRECYGTIMIPKLIAAYVAPDTSCAHLLCKV